jgi:hypothetical protein
MEVKIALFLYEPSQLTSAGRYTFCQGWEQLLSDLYVLILLLRNILIDVSHGDKTRLWVRDELNRLSRQTSTFIATPPDGDNTVLGHSTVILGPADSY